MAASRRIKLAAGILGGSLVLTAFLAGRGPLDSRAIYRGSHP